MTHNTNPAHDIKLNLGCGTKPLDQFYNFDLTPLSPNVYKLDLESDPLPFPDSSVTYIQAIDLIEHLSNPQHLIAECFRVLKPGSKFFIRVPHFSYHRAYEDPTHRTLYSALSFSYFAASHRRSYEVAGKFNSFSVRLTFLHRWYLPLNILVDALANISNSTLYLYEVSFLRSLFPAENVVTILTK